MESHLDIIELALRQEDLTHIQLGSLDTGLVTVIIDTGCLDTGDARVLLYDSYRYIPDASGLLEETFIGIWLTLL